jgi:nitrogen fixation NifU-like protein
MPFDDEQEVYQDHILDHYEDPYHRGHCEHATHAHEDDNPLCGDVIHVELQIGDQDRIRSAWFDGDGCCISQASASMLMEKIEGMTVDDLRQFTAQDMLALFGARLTPNRQKCCLLSWRVVRAAVHSPVGASTVREAAPANTAPANTAPANTAPANTAPANTAPANTVKPTLPEEDA